MCVPATDTAQEGGDAMAAVAAVVWFLIRYTCIGGWWLTRHALAPAAVFLSIGGWRWTTGADLLRGGRKTGARWLHGAAVPVTARQWRWGIRCHWAYWPGWQRTAVRLTTTLLTVCAALWPLWTSLAVATAVLLTAAAAVGWRHRLRMLARPRRVDLITAHRAPAAAICVSPTLTVSTDTGTQSYATP